MQTVELTIEKILQATNGSRIDPHPVISAGGLILRHVRTVIPIFQRPILSPVNDFSCLTTPTDRKEAKTTNAFVVYLMVVFLIAGTAVALHPGEDV